MRPRAFLSAHDIRAGAGTPEDLRIGKEILGWMENRIIKPNPQIMRPLGSQAICPFVRMTLNVNALVMVIHHHIDGTDADTVEHIVRACVSQLKDTTALLPQKSRKLCAVVIAFSNIPTEKMKILTQSQKKLKDTLVPEGYMIGEFYETCTQPAAYNPEFTKVMWSPVPLMVLRHMLEHDILFLGNSREHFLEFDSRFGSHFEDPEKLPLHEKHLYARYAEARNRFLVSV